MNRFILILFVLGNCALVGCKEKTPAVYPVFGTITLDGEPVSGASITFYPDAENRNPSAARTDDNGNFRLTTFQSGDGAMEGTYKVKVTKITSGVGKSPYDEDYAEWAAAEEAAIARGEEPELPESTNALPEKYADKSTSGLTAEVKAQEENRVDFNLVSTPAAE